MAHILLRRAADARVAARVRTPRIQHAHRTDPQQRADVHPKQIELPKQEIAEIVKANLNAVKWFGIAAAFLFLTVIAFAVFIIGLIAIWLPLWAASLIALVLFGLVTAFFGWGGYKRLELRGPTRPIQSFKETVRWAKARVLGRNAS